MKSLIWLVSNYRDETAWFWGLGLWGVWQSGASSLKSELESLNCFKTALRHAESICTVLGENVQRHPYWSARFQISGLEGRGRLESDVEIWGPVIIQLTSLSIAERPAGFLQLQLTEEWDEFYLYCFCFTLFSFRELSKSTLNPLSCLLRCFNVKFLWKTSNMWSRCSFLFSLFLLRVLFRF